MKADKGGGSDELGEKRREREKVSITDIKADRKATKQTNGIYLFFLS